MSKDVLLRGLTSGLMRPDADPPWHLDAATGASRTPLAP